MKNSTENLPKPPRSLSREAKGWWKKITQEYGICDEGGILILQVGLEAFDKMRRAQATISAEGETIRDRFDQTKSHPMHSVERDARNQLLAALKQLHLDIDQDQAGVGVPPGGEQLNIIGLDQFRR